MPISTDTRPSRRPPLRISRQQSNNNQHQHSHKAGSGFEPKVDLVSNLTAKHWLERSEALLLRRDLPAATASFFHSEHLGADPDRCSAGRRLAALLSGNYEAAWRESDAIRKRGAPDPNRFWQGEDIRGKRVLVRCLHGFGDAVQMLRYAPKLRALASHVHFEVPPRLLELAPLFPGVGEVVAWGEAAPGKPPQWDVQIEAMELPYLFRTTVKDLPLTSHALDLPEDLIQRTKIAMGRTDRLRVGLVWEAGASNPSRSLPFGLLDPILHHEHIEFWNLQGGPAGWQAAGTSLRDACSITGDGIPALAATIANLDLILTVDTLAAHLAGALGKPAWLLLEHQADWRWIANRHDSPWYPTLRLFRQPVQNAWSPLIQTVSTALSQLASPRNPQESSSKEVW